MAFVFLEGDLRFGGLQEDLGVGSVFRVEGCGSRNTKKGVMDWALLDNEVPAAIAEVSSMTMGTCKYMQVATLTLTTAAAITATATSIRHIDLKP